MFNRLIAAVVAVLLGLLFAYTWVRSAANHLGEREKQMIAEDRARRAAAKEERSKGDRVKPARNTTMRELQVY